MPVVNVQVAEAPVVEVKVEQKVVVVEKPGGGCDHPKYLGEYEVVT